MTPERDESAPGLTAKIVATIVVILVVATVWKVIDYRMQPPPPPASASSAP
ncbi:MAG: hypothetical protein ABR526_03070 [Chthoniobacterales bacterium]